MFAISRLYKLLVGLIAVGLSTALIAGPDIQSWSTANGSRVLFVAAPDLPMVDVRVVFDAGSARDGELPGLSDMTNSLLNDGAGDWDADQIAERLEEVGARLGLGSEQDMAWVSVRTLTEQNALERSIELISTILAKPTFEQDDLERTRKSMQTSLRLDEQKPGSVAKKAFFRALFREHPYAIPGEGTQVSLAAINRDHVVAFHKRYYVAGNAVVAIVGALDRAQAEQLAERVTAGLAPGQPATALPPVLPLTDKHSESLQFPSSQSHILMGQMGMHRGDPDYFVLYVGNHILGGSGLVSQLTNEVREKRGLSYSVYSYFAPLRRDGPFLAGAQTQNSKVQEAIEVMRETLRIFIEQGPTEEELTAAKQNITGGFPLRIASNSNIVEYLAMIGFYRLPLDYLEVFVDRINAVSREQIQETFKRRLDLNRFVTVVVGNGKSAQPEG